MTDKATIAKPRYQRRKQARPQEILESATRVFAQKGYTDSRIEDVADAAGISKGTVYVYYKNKDELFRAVLMHYIDSEFETLRNIAPKFEGSAEELLRLILHEMAQQFIDQDTGSIVWGLVRDGEKLPELVEFFRTEILEHGLNALRDVLKMGQATGEFRDCDVDVLPDIIVSPLLTALTHRKIFSPRYAPMDLPRYTEAHIDMVLAGLKNPR